VYTQQRGTGQLETDPQRADRRIADPEAAERSYNARAALDSLANAARFLEGVRGRRKALLYFSEGIDYDIHDVFFNQDATIVLDSVRNAIAAATRGNVAIYSIDPRGLTSLADETIEMAGTFPEDPAYGINSRSLANELQLSQDSLRVLAEETGGYAIVNSNDFRGGFDRVVRENSAYYVLGYYPTNDRRDGRFRKIEVRVKRPGMQVRARRGYVAPKGRPATPATEAASGTSAPLRDALNSPIAQSGLQMGVAAAPFKGELPKASVLVTIQLEGRHFRFDDSGGQSQDKLEVSLMAIDAKSGKVQDGDHQNVELKLRPQTRQAVEMAGFRLLSRLSLLPGRYQLRVGARTAASEAVGTVHYDLEVPDFSKQPLSMSGLVISSDLSGLVPTARADEQLKEVLKAPPTTHRDFSVADTLFVFGEVYDNDSRGPHRVDVRTALRAEDGRVVFNTAEDRGSDELGGARGGYGVLTEIPLRDVAPGQYVLRMEAQSRASGSTPVSREALIRVWPLPQRQTTANAPQTTVVAVARGAQSGVDAAKTVVARNNQEWHALWSSLPMRRAAPNVNFENTMIAAVFLGSRPSAGYAVDIVSARFEQDVLVVGYVERVPAPGTASADVITTPYAIAGVPMSTGDVRFERVDAK
jgi:hypothetical protein